jgi:hypothetical protein
MEYILFLLNYWVYCGTSQENSTYSYSKWFLPLKKENGKYTSLGPLGFTLTDAFPFKKKMSEEKFRLGLLSLLGLTHLATQDM